jgi:hypothetical protein
VGERKGAFEEVYENSTKEKIGVALPDKRIYNKTLIQA